MAGFGTKCSFNATSMWESLRGKRMMFVGDSLNRNQFASLICLLHSVIPDSAKSMQTVNSIIVFRAEVIWNELLLDAFLVLSRNDVSSLQNGQHGGVASNVSDFICKIFASIISLCIIAIFTWDNLMAFRGWFEMYSILMKVESKETILVFYR